MREGKRIKISKFAVYRYGIAIAIVSVLLIFILPLAVRYIQQVFAGPPPTSTSITPNEGPSLGGQTTTVTGTNFIDGREWDKMSYRAESSDGHSCAIARFSGDVYCWGRNTFGGVGDGTAINRQAPVNISQIPGSSLYGKTVTQISQGWVHTCALTTDNHMHCWGYNGMGNLGIGNVSHRYLPVDITTVSGSQLNGKQITKMALGGHHTCAYSPGNGLYCWGWNPYGQVGDGSSSGSNRLYPVRVYTSSFDNLALGGAHSCITTTTTTTYVRCWGLNDSGNLGNGSSSNQYTAGGTTITVSISSNARLVAGGKTTCVWQDNAPRAYCWGHNLSGKIGNNSTSNRYYPTFIANNGSLNGRNIVDMSIGEAHTCALDSLGRAHCWGSGSDGQTALGTFSTYYTPRLVPQTAALSGELIDDLTVGLKRICFLTQTNKIVCAGNGDYYQLGYNSTSTTDRNTTTAVSLVNMPALSTLVNFGGVSRNGTYVSPTQISVVTPPHTPGTVSVTLTSPDGQSTTLPSSYTFKAVPTITAVSPSEGPLAGGQTITITGTAFQSPMTVSVEGNPCTTVTLLSSTSLTCVVPAHTAGYKDVTVTDQYAQANTMLDAYHYKPAPTVSATSPTEGPIAGGQTITLTGTNFQTPMTVTIGGVSCLGVSVTTATSLTCSTPAHTPGAKDIIVTDQYSQSATITAGYNYKAVPQFAAVSPSEGPMAGGQLITITGSNFQSPMTVTVGGSLCTASTVTNPTELTCTTPASATSGAKDIVITDQYAQSVTQATAYSYKLAPTVSAITPGEGPLAGTQAVTISGANFQTPMVVTIGANSCINVVVVSSSELTCDRPASVAGLVDVTVQDQYSQQATLTGAYNYKPLPVITSTIPASGTTSGGDTLTITGVNFNSGTAVSIGVTACTITSYTATLLTCTTGSSVNGTSDIIVTDSYGQVATLANAYTYYIPPYANSVYPGVGTLAGGTTITITGTQFEIGADLATVAVDGNPCTVVSQTATTISCTTPAGSNVDTVDVVVTNPTSGLVSVIPSSFTYATVPVVPTGLSTAPQASAIELNWVAPVDGGATISDYVVEYSSDGGATWLVFSDGVSTGTTATVTGLLPAVDYNFRVSAVNVIGTSAPTGAIADSLLYLTTSTSSTNVSFNLKITSTPLLSSSRQFITTSTNSATGYQATLEMAGSSRALKGDSGANIAPHSASQTSPTTLGINSWGYRVPSVASFGAGGAIETNRSGGGSYLWAGVPANGLPNVICNTATPVQDHVCSVYYAVRGSSTIPTGTYQNTVIYTVIAK